MLRFLLVALGALVALFLAVVVLAWRYQERVVWQPPAGGAPYAPFGDPSVRQVGYVAEDGQRLIAYLVTPQAALLDSATRARQAAFLRRSDSAMREHIAALGSPPQPSAPRRGGRGWNGRVLIAFHGNAETAAGRVPWARELAERTGWSVLVPEYRGYAGLPGVPSYEGSSRDARAAHAWVRDSLGIPPERIGILGYSLGSAVATELAEEVGPSVLVLEAPFTSARDMARIATAWPVAAMWGAIARVHFDTRARVARLDAPVWVAHGAADRIIPSRMGRAVHAAARRKGELLIVPEAGHVDLLQRAGPTYWGFLEAALGSAAGTDADRPRSVLGGRDGG